MVHEAMVLEYSGRHLALMDNSAVYKTAVFITLMANVLIPHAPAYSFHGNRSNYISLIIYIIRLY
jgi:formate hydrogenlyase subunit 4